MASSLAFPTPLHQQVADLTNDFFTAHAQVDTVVVVNSCARGRATPESDLDLAVLVAPETTAQDVQQLEKLWGEFSIRHPLVREFKNTGPFAHLHVDVFDGRVTPLVWDEGGGPDSFEVEIGNRFAYGVPLHNAGRHFRHLQSKWLPYYGDSLRAERLSMVRRACAYDLDHVPVYVRRGLHFQAFDRLYKAFQEFLQALFIARRKYPLAYNKWIREQVEGWLRLPELYRELPTILSVRDIASDQLVGKANDLRHLTERWTNDQ
jgi:predicted nucleotidyltransferase